MQLKVGDKVAIDCGTTLSDTGVITGFFSKDAHVKFQIRLNNGREAVVEPSRLIRVFSALSVYYARGYTHNFLCCPDLAFLDNIETTHSKVDVLGEMSLERAYETMQGDNPALQSDYFQDHIKKLDVNHTSMSVGDAFLTEDGWFVVMPMGFKFFGCAKDKASMVKIAGTFWKCKCDDGWATIDITQIESAFAAKPGTISVVFRSGNRLLIDVLYEEFNQVFKEFSQSEGLI